MSAKWIIAIGLVIGLLCGTGRHAEAGIGTPGQRCTAADYQAANDCLSSWVGLGGLFGGCNLLCNELDAMGRHARNARVQVLNCPPAFR